MKIKTEFVTNSSSASFIVDTKKITDLQKFLILNHVEFVKEYHPEALEYVELFGTSVEKIASSGWTIIEEDGFLKGDTSMDNFDMEWFLREIGLHAHAYEYYNN